MDALPAMSWRRFRVLLGGLGPNSALVAQLQARKPRAGKRGSYDRVADHVIDADRNPAAFDAFWQSITGGKRHSKNGRSS
jgi:hypothetical protein